MCVVDVLDRRRSYVSSTFYDGRMYGKIRSRSDVLMKKIIDKKKIVIMYPEHKRLRAVKNKTPHSTWSYRNRILYDPLTHKRHLDIFLEEDRANYKIDLFFNTQKMFSLSARNYLTLAIIEVLNFLKKTHKISDTACPLYLFLFNIISNHIQILIL